MATCPVRPRPTTARQGRRRVAVAAVAFVALVGSLLTGVAVAGPASADGPGAGVPWVVTLGDSYISGEAGRWAGNTNLGSRRADALGPTAYFDNAAGTAEQVKGCHRSRSRGGCHRRGRRSVNFACSGATHVDHRDRDGHFKPGLDFYDDGPGQQGQARLLQTFARSHNVKMVVGRHRRQRLQLRHDRSAPASGTSCPRRVVARTTATTTRRSGPTSAPPTSPR